MLTPNPRKKKGKKKVPSVPQIMKSTYILTLLLLLLLLSTSLLSSAAARVVDDNKPKNQNDKNHDAPGFGSDPGGMFGPGGVFNIPGWGNVGGGYGGGYGGPGGGYAHGGVVRPSTVCTERGPCYKRKLTCPAKCFSSYSRSGRHGGGGGGGGGCTIDCKKCVAYC